jgi:hypothetical protein
VQKSEERRDRVLIPHDTHHRGVHSEQISEFIYIVFLLTPTGYVTIMNGLWQQQQESPPAKLNKPLVKNYKRINPSWNRFINTRG